MSAFPCHVLSDLDGGLRVREQHAIPVLLQSTVSPFYGVVFAVVRRIVGKPDAHSVVVNEVQGSFDELCASAAVLGTVVEVDHQCRRPILGFPFGPALLYAIPNIVTRYFRFCKGDE